MKHMVLTAVASIFIAGCVTTSRSDSPAVVEVVRGDYRAVAACVYDGWENEAPGNTRLADLSALKQVRVSHTFVASGMFSSVQFIPVETTLSPRSENETLVEIRLSGSANRSFADRSLSFATNCSLSR